MDKYEILTSGANGWHAYAIYELYPDGTISDNIVHSTQYIYFSKDRAMKAAEHYIQNHLMPDKW